MKKFLLSLFALALTVSANAQQEPATDGVYYLYNVESGMFLTRGASWGTRGVTRPVGLPWKVERTGSSSLKLRMLDISSDNAALGLGDNCFTDNGSPVDFNFEGTSEGYTLKLGENYLNAPAEAGEINYTADASTWQFLSNDEYKAKMAARTAEKEAAIAEAMNVELGEKSLAEVVGEWRAMPAVNDGIPAESTWTWTLTASGRGNAGWGNYGSEMYQTGGQYERTIEGLEPGLYKVKARGQKRMTWNEKCAAMGNDGYFPSDAYLEANGSLIAFKAWAEDRMDDGNPNNTNQFVECVNQGKYITEGFVLVGEDGKLNLKAISEAWWNGGWFLFNGVEYQALSDKMSQEDIDALLASIPEDAPMNYDVREALAAAKAAFEANANIANYNALSAAIAAANASIAAYASAEQALRGRLDLVASTNFLTSEAAINYAELPAEAWTEGTLTDAEAASLKNPYSISGWHSDTEISDLLLPAWKVGGEQCYRYDKSLYINTWSNEGENDGSEFKVPFFEYWVGDNDLLGNNVLTGTVADVEPGVYDVTAWVRVRLSNGKKDETATGITLNGVDVCDGDQVGDSQFRIKQVTAQATVGTDGILTAEFVVENANINWLSFQNVNYTYNDLATSIRDLRNNAETNQAIYNLAGQRIEKMQQGINIINGKKVVKK